MKFRNPRTGEVFNRINDAVNEACARFENEEECPFYSADRCSCNGCNEFYTDAPVEAARILGYEVIREFKGVEIDQFKTDESKTVEVKRDTGKPRLDLVPLECLIPLAEVREFAAQKYGADGIEAWREISNDRLFAAILRHLVAARRGENDPESGLPAIYHVLCNAAFLAIKRMEENK